MEGVVGAKPEEDVGATVAFGGKAQFKLARAASVINAFDGVVYPLSTAGYATANTLALALTDGPLQPGPTRFNIAATVTDRAGNPPSQAQPELEGSRYRVRLPAVQIQRFLRLRRE